MGFSDRINDTLRGAKTALGVAEMRQRLAEAVRARDESLTELGALVCATYAGGQAEDVDPRFSDAWRQAETASSAVSDLQSQVNAMMIDRTAGQTRKFCGTCGAQMDVSAGFCPTCGAPSG